MDQPLINTRDYSVTGLIFNGVGCLLWVIAYVVLVREIRKKKFVEMPAYVAGANIGWEFVWSFFYHPDTGLLYSLSYQAAFFLDCYIFYSTLRYGTKQPIHADMVKYFKYFCIINFAFWILFCYFYRNEGYDTLNGANSGYIINVILSLQCLFMLFQTKDTARFSMVLAWSRMLGTGLITVSLFYFFPENQFVKFLGLSCLVIDNTFITVLWRRHGKLI
ncbi:hypothetical protein [Spirosoma sp. KNUC1025]|uniref:transmembrane-type terpene cyclase n=1 Tax=Spirosoma sp. KNUC1025 TaxID=2894082 RepID=UPI0038660D1E|nr:hypothetical protein LN737_08030 [Spirosoma sp. KNUC1025]